MGIRPAEITAGFGDDRLWELNLFPRFHPDSPYNLNENVHAEHYYPEDMELARTLVEESDYDGEPIRVIGSRDLAGWYVQAIGILPMLQEMGLNAELIIVDRPTQLEVTQDTSQWEMKTSYSTPIRRVAVLGFHGRHRDGRQWPWANAEHLYYEGVLWTDLNRRQEAITRMVQIELERAGSCGSDTLECFAVSVNMCMIFRTAITSTSTTPGWNSRGRTPGRTSGMCQ
ncbi:MAG: hypothetical protein WD942_01695 [Dehalococcoidia bacterium]